MIFLVQKCLLTPLGRKCIIPSSLKYPASRIGLGLDNFNKIKARVDIDGFSRAVEIALLINVIKPKEIPMLKTEFYKRIAKFMREK